MVDRDIVGSLLEALNRVATVAHHLGNQGVSLAGGAGGVVNEPGLCRLPRHHVAPLGSGLKSDDVDLAVPLLTRGEVRLRGVPITRSGNRPLVLGSEVLLQPLRAAAEQDHHREQHHDDDGDADG
jgi:hypothetical protein